MKVLFIAVFFFINATSYSQSIHFAPLSWRDALAKAKAENKMLFVEMYTTWCTYCKQMERDVFTLKETGDYYNEHFINVRYDAQKIDGIQIRKSYAMLGFPTYLYLNPEGLVILKTAGFQETKKFIANGDSAITLHTKKIEQL